MPNGLVSLTEPVEHEAGLRDHFPSQHACLIEGGAGSGGQSDTGTRQPLLDMVHGGPEIVPSLGGRLFRPIFHSLQLVVPGRSVMRVGNRVVQLSAGYGGFLLQFGGELVHLLGGSLQQFFILRCEGTARLQF